MEAPKVREDIAKGVIGDVLHSEALFAVPIDKVDRIMKKEMGGRQQIGMEIKIASRSSTRTTRPKYPDINGSGT